MIISSECIEFSGYIGTHGYGHTSKRVNGKVKTFKAHRLAYEKAYGAIPDGMHVCHKCDFRACINPDHLFIGTNADNVRDREAKGRGNQVKGSACGRAKLTEQDIPRIRDMIACGCTNIEIGKWFGVSDSTIYNIKHGKRWKHV